MPLLSELSDLRGRLQGDLFPWLERRDGPLSDEARLFLTIVEMIPVGAFVPRFQGHIGRPSCERVPLLRAFIAKAVWNMPTTKALIERLHADPRLVKWCGWTSTANVPSEATFSRAFAGFAAGELPMHIHERLICKAYKGRIVENVARDSTAIVAREKAEKVATPPRCRKKVKPKRGEPGWETLNRLDRQREMTRAEMLADLPRHCAVGVKPDAKGRKQRWTGYKLHLDTADGGVPLASILTSASLHDSQAAIPLSLTTAGRVTYLYDLMDASYDMDQIRVSVEAQGRVPVIAAQPRRGGKEQADMEARARRNIRMPTAKDIRYRQRTSAERVNARLKDEFGGRFVRVRGAAKVSCHLMFGVLALTVDQLMRLIL